MISAFVEIRTKAISLINHKGTGSPVDQSNLEASTCSQREAPGRGGGGGGLPYGRDGDARQKF